MNPVVVLPSLLLPLSLSSSSNEVNICNKRIWNFLWLVISLSEWQICSHSWNKIWKLKIISGVSESRLEYRIFLQNRNQFERKISIWICQVRTQLNYLDTCWFVSKLPVWVCPPQPLHFWHPTNEYWYWNDKENCLTFFTNTIKTLSIKMCAFFPPPNNNIFLRAICL